METLIRTPRQDRSQLTMARVLDTFEKLLRHKAYDQITVNEISEKSQAAVSSIYARFKDKRAILFAVFDRLRDDTAVHFRKTCSRAVEKNDSFEGVLNDVILALITWYRQHDKVIKAAFLLNDRYIYERTAANLRLGSVALAQALTATLPAGDPEQTARCAKFVFRIVSAVMHDQVVFDTIKPWGKAWSTRDLANQITKAAIAQLPQSSWELSNHRAGTLRSKRTKGANGSAAAASKATNETRASETPRLDNANGK